MYIVENTKDQQPAQTSKTEATKLKKLKELIEIFISSGGTVHSHIAIKHLIQR